MGYDFRTLSLRLDRINFGYVFYVPYVHLGIQAQIIYVHCSTAIVVGITVAL